ncbi:MAG: 50S ribosomal protein L11 methyltransferase [Pseudolabrys sp.]
MGPTTRARLICVEPTAHRLAAFAGENLDPDDTVCAAFEGDNGAWLVEIHFRVAPDEAAVRKMIAQDAGAAAADALIFDQVAAEDWVAASLAGLKPVIAGRFVVHGAHDRACIPSNSIGIEIEAALAFGTGHHGTTRGCLLALDDLARRRRFERVLDLGTGSGVLAIAAAKIFRAPVLATDIDPVAVTAARANARLNRTSAWIETIRADGANARKISLRGPFDLVFANILIGPLMRMATPVVRLTAPGARIVLSGLLPGQANAVLAIYRAQRLTLERKIRLDGWITLVMRRN